MVVDVSTEIVFLHPSAEVSGYAANFVFTGNAHCTMPAARHGKASKIKFGQAMFSKTVYAQIAIIFLFACSISGCQNVQRETAIPSTPSISASAPILPTSTFPPTVSLAHPSPAHDLSAYAFPDSINVGKRYMFYLHGKIIEDQGIPAISPDFGEYEYEAILEKLSDYGFIVISEQRPKNTDAAQYATRISKQVTALLEAGVPARNITVVGASKGAGITIFASHLLENEEINYVILAICHPDEIETLKQNQIFLFGNILSIYDSVDEYAGSCKELFSFSEGKGISRYDEITLNIGTGHGILYQPLDAWILPTVQWATQ